MLRHQPQRCFKRMRCIRLRHINTHSATFTNVPILQPLSSVQERQPNIRASPDSFTYNGIVAKFTLPLGNTKFKAQYSTQSQENVNKKDHIIESNESKQAEGESSEDHYVLQHIPSSNDVSSTTSISQQITPFSLPSSSSPMERILHAWTDTVAESRNHGSRGQKEMNLGIDAAKETAIQQTLSWFDQIMKKQQRNEKQRQIIGSSNVDITTSTYNEVLKMLAESIYSASQLNVNNVNESEEQIASRILEQMKASDNPNSQPDIETYNAYIACLRRTTAQEASKAAETILKELHSLSMSNATEPKPNVGTYNAVLSWHAMNQESTESIDMSKIEELYQEMTTQMNITPNYHTFQIILHGCTKRICNTPNYQFISETNSQVSDLKPHHAQLWIERMSAILGKDSIDPGFWNLTLPFPTSRFYPSHIMTQTKLASSTAFLTSSFKWKTEWDDRERRLFPQNDSMHENLKTLYKYKSLVSPTDPEAQEKIQRAQNLEKWVEYIVNSTNSSSSSEPPILQTSEGTAQSEVQSQNIEDRTQYHPTMEALDAIILAWVETCTKEGILRAESWALRALEFHHLKQEVHVNTFLPILIAWSMCGEEYGVRRVEEWISKLDEMSGICEEEQSADGSFSDNQLLKPNTHVVTAAIQGWIMYQTALFLKREPESKQAVLDAAIQSTAWLEKLCSLEPNPELHVAPLDGSAFAHVIDAWEKVLRSQLFGIVPSRNNIQKAMDPSVCRLCADNIFRVIELMNSKIVKHTGHETQMFDLISTFHEVYGVALRSFKNAKYLGQDDLQVNSRFIPIQQMLYSSDILYPHLIEKSAVSSFRESSLSDLVQVGHSLNALSHPRFIHEYLVYFNHKTSTNDDALTFDANIGQGHTYSFFYSHLLRLSKTLHPSFSKGLKLKMYYGVMDRIGVPTSPMYEPNSNSINLWLFIVKNCLDFTPTFNDRSELMDKALEYLITKNLLSFDFFNVVETTMRKPYVVDPDVNILEEWINERKTHCQYINDGDKSE